MDYNLQRKRKSLCYTQASQVVLVVKNPSANAGDIKDVSSIPGLERSPGGGHATHSSILAWRIPWTGEPGWLQSIGLQRVRHDWNNLAPMHAIYMKLTQHCKSAIFHFKNIQENRYWVFQTEGVPDSAPAKAKALKPGDFTVTCKTWKDQKG